MKERFHNRTEAGQQLAQALLRYANRPDVIVLTLPRGGVPVAYEVATTLQVPLDLCLVRKLGVPDRPELAMGAIASPDICILNHDIIDSLKLSAAAFAQVVRYEEQELARRDRCYRGDRPAPDLRDRIVIVIDDGVATGSTLRAAIAALKLQSPAQLIVAVPVAPQSTAKLLKQEVDDFVCLKQPEHLYSISLWYEDFSQTSDAEVKQLLSQAMAAIAL
ncbi:MAG: phosphoribosyltransferase [Leptolyngbyaceae cyanobacterium SM1_1_3]|nr:phosphoribosyltransferase [Leptolyngbyaceae cyanobacterium SM1_1_3]NJN02368.1 phosphoribosyltransferase [Leptolyngbyaceae cyanobacterium RM1_1_2]NJO10402.1 phosphoribosyltransferase [Leptolyngbyaceae cyanobacterium SL_1_1]